MHLTFIVKQKNSTLNLGGIPSWSPEAASCAVLKIEVKKGYRLSDDGALFVSQTCNYCNYSVMLLEAIKSYLKR